MLISDFDYELPEELVAQFPCGQRRGSRLLVVADGLEDRRFAELPDLLRPCDLLVFNDTRVIKARLRGRKQTGGRVELLIERIEDEHRALAHVKASKTPREGMTLIIDGGIECEVAGREGELFALDFAGPIRPFLDAHGEVPLPPYLKRAEVAADAERYQTVYARDPGAVAAPTAGLHFDAAMLEETLAAGARHAWVTLHVGAGTFQPLRHAEVEANRLHSERVRVATECCDAVRRAREEGGRVIAVGTTSVRALESAADGGEIRPFDGETELFIRPGCEFRAVDAIITNFHLPQSSLLMLVSAFAGRERVLEAYRHAVRKRYRFFSYGDAMFLTPAAHR